MKEIYHSKIMNPLCEQAGCDANLAGKHAWKWETKRWHAHPSMAFRNWWEPDGFDPVSGAHQGGHPEAHRQWARKDPDGWKRRWFGVSCVDAWNTTQYVEEFDAWTQAGSPDREEPFVSVSATMERQKQLFAGLKSIIDKIGKKMPKVSEGSIALERDVTRTMPDP